MAHENAVVETKKRKQREHSFSPTEKIGTIKKVRLNAEPVQSKFLKEKVSKSRLTSQERQMMQTIKEVQE